MSTQKFSRRSFLRTAVQGSAGVGAALALPTIIAPRALGGQKSAAPSDRIRLGFIGVRKQGTQLLKSAFVSRNLIEVVALCDVDRAVLDEAKHFVEKQSNRACAVHHDYRKLLDDANIDAVVIATPDHWHALPTIHACQAGKDVYCEKPLSLTVAEGQAMVAAAQDNRRIVQTGSKQRSDERFRLACELVRAGRIGKVHTIRVGIAPVNFDGPAVADCDPPKELDYEFWLGPAPKRSYNPNRVHYNFRFFWDYSGGQLTNWGAHHLDIAQWGLGRDASGPISAEGEARYHKDHWYEVPQWCRVVYKYDDGTTILCGHDEHSGTKFEGEKGTIFVDRGVLETKPADLVDHPLPKPDLRAMGDNHMRNWLECVRSRQSPVCDVAIGHRSATLCNLGNIAIRSGRKVNWNPAGEKIEGDAEQLAMLSRPYRAPWALPRV